MLVKMSTSAFEHKINDWDSHKFNNNIESDSEKRTDFENNEHLFEADHFDIRVEADKGDCLDFTQELQKDERTPVPQKVNCKSEVEKEEFKTESDGSDVDSEKSQTGSELFDRLNELQITGCGDGMIDSTIPAYDEPNKTSGTTRRARGNQDAGSILRESCRDQFQHRPTTEETTDCKKDDASGDSTPCTKMLSGNTSVKSATTPLDWLKYTTPKAICLIILSLIYLGLTIFGIKVLNMPATST